MVVNPVDVDVASEPVDCSVCVVVVSLAASVESGAFVDDFEDEDSVDDGVSAHATGSPYPVTTGGDPRPRRVDRSKRGAICGTTF